MSSIMQHQRSGSYRSRTLSPRPVNNTMDLDRKLGKYFSDLNSPSSQLPRQF